MSYGYFSPDGKSYSITTPKTPMSWMNYLYNDQFLTTVDQILSGQSKIVIGYVPTPFTDGNRKFYIRDRKSGAIWQPNGFEVKGEFRCEHFVNKTVLHYEEEGIGTDICIFVPTEGFREYWTVTLTNRSAEQRELSLFSSVGLLDRGPMGGTCSYEDGVIDRYSFPYHTFYHEKEKVEKTHSHGYFMTDTLPASYDMSAYRYFGNYLSAGTPVAVENDTCSGIVGEVEPFVGAMQHTFSLAPGQSATVSFAVGQAVTVEEIKAVKAGFTAEYVAEELARSDRHAEKLVGRSSIETPNPEFNHLVNHWLKKQATFLTRLNRMGVYNPIRNQYQDTMGYSMVQPEEAVDYMLRLVARQEKSGYTKQWYMADGSKPVKLCLLDHCDADVWVILCICALANQNGDLSLFDRVVPYIDGGEDTVYRHLLQAVEYMSTDVGAHGLSLMHDGDWTDPINGIGKDGKGESTWTTVAMMYAIRQLRPICEARGDAKAVARLDEVYNAFDHAVNTYAWNGDRYIGGYDDNGIAYADTADQDRILLNPQTWAIMAGAARGERLEAVIRTIDGMNCTHGTYVNYPPFYEWDGRWGRISVKKAGTSENGAVYCHATMFKAFSDAAIRDGDKLYQSLLRTTPVNPENPVEINRQVPLFVPNYYYSLEGSPNFGRSSNAYGTGTVSWMLMAAMEKLAGVQATVFGLRVDPVIPKAWDEVKCTRTFRKATYRVTVRRGAETTVNGKPFAGEYLPYEDGGEYEVVWGI